MRWTNTVEAVLDTEQTHTKGQWRIGDAMIKDRGPPQNEKTNDFKECADRLKDAGVTSKRFSPRYCKQLFLTASSFSRDNRNSKYSWDAHCAAGSPENLKKAAAALRKLDKDVTLYTVRDLIKHWREKADAQRRAKVAAAKSRREKATADKANAAREKLGTSDPDKRAIASQKIEEARKQIEELTQQIKLEGGPPPFNADLDVDTEDLAGLRSWAIYFEVILHVKAMEKQAKETIKGVSKVADYLSPDQQQEIAEHCNRIVGILNSILALAKQPVHRPTPKLISA